MKETICGILDLVIIHVHVVSRESKNERVREEQVCIKGRKKQSVQAYQTHAQVTYRHWQNVWLETFEFTADNNIAVKGTYGLGPYEVCLDIDLDAAWEDGLPQEPKPKIELYEVLINFLFVQILLEFGLTFIAAFFL